MQMMMWRNDYVVAIWHIFYRGDFKIFEKQNLR